MTEELTIDRPMPSAYVTPSTYATPPRRGPVGQATGFNDEQADAPVPPGKKRAVLYLRVSSKGQVNTDYDPEGISLPAQRKACERKAEQLGLEVIDEYVEPGRSATDMSKRIAFQEMLERIRRDKDVDHVIVHKLNRFARNRLDDAIVMANLKKRGVTLISVVENIDDSPVGQLMHGILAAFNEYRSAEDGADISYKMGEKAKNGGTIGQAALGYLNTIERFEGRDVRTVIVDPERGPLVRQAFELYADGDFTLDELAAEMADRGLLTRPTTKAPAQQLSSSVMSRLLRKRYYLGYVTHKGVEYQGRHPAIVDLDLFDRVQVRLESRSVSGERRRVNRNYLVGSLFCGHCQDDETGTVDRMVVQRSLGNGGEYFYFFCRGRQKKTCDAPYSNYLRVEDAIGEHYKTIRFTPEFIDSMRSQMDATLADADSSHRAHAQQIKDQLTKLATQEENLLDLLGDGTLPSAKVRARLRKIEEQRARLKHQAQEVDAQLAEGVAHVEACLALLEDPAEVYRRVDDETRRELNQAIFKRLYVVNDTVTGHEMNEPLAELFALEAGDRVMEATGDAEAATRAAGHAFGNHAPERNKAALAGDLASYRAVLAAVASSNGSSNDRLVELRGIEPRSSSIDPGLLRVQSVGIVFSAPVLDADTSPTGSAS